MDYYLSSHPYHLHHFTASAVPKQHLTPFEFGEGHKPVIDNEYAQNFFYEQLIQFDSLGFYFNRPSMAEVVARSGDSYKELLVHRPPLFYERIVSHANNQNTPGSKALLSLAMKKQSLGNDFHILLCPQHLPKFHPNYDEILLSHITKDPNTVVVLVDNPKKSQWKRTLMQRWKHYIVDHIAADHSDKNATELNKIAQNTLQQIVWMPSLKPQEYLMLLGLGDVMLDQFPFGGGVTTLESLAVCTPVVTLPAQQNVPQLAAGMLRSLQLSSHVNELLMVQNAQDYLHSIDELLSSSVAIREEICQKILQDQMLFEDMNTVREWDAFLIKVVEHFRTSPVETNQ